MCQNGGVCGTLDAHLEGEDEQRVKDGVDDDCSNCGTHCHMRMSCAAQGTVQTEVEVGHHIAIEDDDHVVVGILQGVFRCAEEQQQGVDEHQSEHSHNDADDDIERHQIAQHPFRCLVVLLS